MGYSEEHAQRMVKLQNDIKAICDGDSDESIVKIEGSRQLTRYSRLHELLLPYWTRLFNKLKCTNVSDVNLYGVCLPRPVLDIMFSTLKSMNLCKLSLNSVQLGSDGLLKLSSYLKDNISLKNLMIGCDTIDLPAASSLSDAIKNHPCLAGVGFIYCGLDNAAALRIILEGWEGKRRKRSLEYK